MLIVLWETGCRNDTLRHLKWVDLRKDETIFLKGKRGHERYVSMDRSIFTELFAFKKGLGDLNKEKKFIWVNPDTQLPYSDEYLRTLVIDYVKNAGIKKHITPHSLRRSFATNLYNNGTDVKKI